MIADDDDDILMKPQEWPKVCSCGKSYDPESWEKLQYLGIQHTGDNMFPDLELRHCGACGTSLAIITPELDIFLPKNK